MTMKRVFLSTFVVLAAVSLAVAGEVAVNEDSEYSGTFGMNVTVDDTNPAYVETDTPSGETTYTFRFYVRANCLTMAGSDAFSVFEALDGSDNAWLKVVLGYTGSDYTITFVGREDGGGEVSSNSTVLPPGWHLIEATWTSGSPGSVVARIDNTSVDGLASLTNSTGSIETARMGAVDDIDAGTSGNMLFDDFASFRTASVIGPVTVFGDVATDSTFYPFIYGLYGAGITGGCGGGNYCPNNSVTRAQMAVFILLGENVTSCSYRPPEGPGTPTFGDVPSGSGYYDWVEEYVAQGFTAGCGGGNYCPNDAVTREQMAVFLLLGKYGVGNIDPPACDADTNPSPFNDVPNSSGFCRWIKQLVDDGITAGCGGGNYCPKDAVTRGQMSAFLTGVYDLQPMGRP
jgi:hypothetical protein